MLDPYCMTDMYSSAARAVGTPKLLPNHKGKAFQAEGATLAFRDLSLDGQNVFAKSY